MYSSTLTSTQLKYQALIRQGRILSFVMILLLLATFGLLAFVFIQREELHKTQYNALNDVVRANNASVTLLRNSLDQKLNTSIETIRSAVIRAETDTQSAANEALDSAAQPMWDLLNRTFTRSEVELHNFAEVWINGTQQRGTRQSEAAIERTSRRAQEDLARLDTEMTASVDKATTTLYGPESEAYFTFELESLLDRKRVV